MGDARSRGNDCDRLQRAAGFHSRLSLVTDRVSPFFLAPIASIAKPLRLSSRFIRSAVERGGPADHSGAAPELIKEEPDKNWGNRLV